ncbi:MAG: acyl-CoA dehydrogenase, partial [Gammaproteobacteria bacterium]
TEEQKRHYLPRLADGREIPCFGLTSPEAGSDASAMTDTGVVCHGEVNGERVLGMRLNWHKRYITLGPVSTLLGLAFRLQDPDGLLGDRKDHGITLALVPVDTPGVDIGKRHLPCLQAFQNGPNWGRDVFLPLDAIIGGRERIGQGWEMLMAALAAGRSISLPALSAGAVKLAARTTGAYARIREQFGIPIGKFEGVQARLARIAGNAYLLEAARRVTTLAIDAGHTPSVVSAIIKSQATFRAREALTDAMDVHGGKTVCDGPSNYLGNLYRAQPVAITVEGANILTRNLIIFGQGAIRCHPYILEEIFAAEDADERRGLERFEQVIYRHLRFATGNFLRAFAHGLTGGRFAAKPRKAGPVGPLYRQLSRYAAALTFVSELALVHLGGALKRKEMISARLGDVQSELYLMSCALKRFRSDGEPA